MSNALTVNQNAMPLPVIADDLNSYLAKISTIELLSCLLYTSDAADE